jgi:hypothetical protein
MTKLLYINDELVDILPNTLIAATFQAGEIGDLRTRATDSTATINLPKTSTNKQTVGNIELVNSLSSFPYRKASVKYSENGIWVIPNGVGIITESADRYKMNVYGGLIDFFASIDGKNVDDMDFEIYETIDDAYIESIRLSLGLFSAPVIDFGTLFPDRQILANPLFISSASWANNVVGGNDTQWEVMPGETQLGFIGTDASLATAWLTQAYKFFDGFTYRLQLTFEITFITSSPPVLDKLDLYIGNDFGSSRQLVGDITSQSALGTFTIDEYIVANNDYEEIQIHADFTVVGGGEEIRVVLRSIKVTDVAGIINIVAPYYIPLISYSQVINKIITNAGYVTNLQMTNQAFYEKLYITFSKDAYEYPQRLIDKMNFRAIASGSQVLVIADAAEHAIEFPVIIESGEYAWYNQVDTFEVPVWPYNIQYEVKARIIVDIEFAGGATSADFYFTVDGITQTLLESVPSAALDRYVFTFDSSVITAGAASKEFKLTVVRAGGAGSITVSVIEAEFWSEVSPLAFGVVNLSALILPTISQKDFMKEFFMRFAIFAKEQSGIIEIPESTEAITLPSLSTGVNIAGPDTDWTTGANPSVTLIGGAGLEDADSDIIAWDYAFVEGNEYDFTLNIDYVFHANTITARINFVILDASDNQLSIYPSSNLTSTSGTYTGPINFVAPAGAAKYGIRVRTFGFGTPTSTVDINTFTATETTPAETSSSDFITLAELQKIIKDISSAVEWTAKRDASINEGIKFTAKNYAQENIFTDITDESVLVTGASDTIDIDNDTLAVSKIFYTSIMAAVEQNNNNGMRLCRIPIWDLTEDDEKGDYTPSPALFYLRSERDGDAEIMYNSVVKTSYLICVYNDPTFEFNTTWEYFLMNYYPLIVAALQKAKTITRAYNLNQVDIGKLDLFKMIYDDSQYYLINKVDKYVQGKSTKVELFKVL